jgi:hypothetical protein
MTLIRKIKQSVEGLNVPDCDIKFIYHSGGVINNLLDRVTFDRSAQYNTYCFLYLLENSSLVETFGMFRERADIILYFAERTDFEFDSLENDAIIERCKQNAIKWIRSIRDGNELQQMSELSMEYLYDYFDINLTGAGLRITVMECAGDVQCTDLPKGRRFYAQFTDQFA